MESPKSTHVVCVGGGHCNVQVLKTLKQLLPSTAKLTLITDNGLAFYSGMLPGAVSSKFSTESKLFFRALHTRIDSNLAGTFGCVVQRRVHQQESGACGS